MISSRPFLFQWCTFIKYIQKCFIKGTTRIYNNHLKKQISIHHENIVRIGAFLISVHYLFNLLLENKVFNNVKTNLWQAKRYR